MDPVVNDGNLQTKNEEEGSKRFPGILCNLLISLCFVSAPARFDEVTHAECVWPAVYRGKSQSGRALGSVQGDTERISS